MAATGLVIPDKKKMCKTPALRTRRACTPSGESSTLLTYFSAHSVQTQRLVEEKMAGFKKNAPKPISLFPLIPVG
jgi:hypothetical protein